MSPQADAGGAPAAAAAAVTRLRLSEFRNHAALDLRLDAGAVCLVGPNGSGKTNILEAVSLLGPGRGLRAAAPPSLRRKTAPPGADWAVFAEALTADGPATLAVGAEPGAPQRRRARLDGAPASQAALARALPTLALTPKDDRLWAGPRSDRLRFFDRLVLAGDPAHAASASAYEKAMRERQALLDRAEAGARPDADWLAALEGEMAEAGVAVAAARLDALARLQAEIDARPETAFPKADLELFGEVEAELAAGAKAFEAEDAFRARLADARRRDGAAGRALSGPHRTELAARHRAKDQPAGDCSTGEQKALLLGLALAQAAALAPYRGVVPILLLDEACAHLDADRRAGLAEAILALGAQAWLTGVDASLFEPFGAHAARFAVGPGRADPLA